MKEVLANRLTRLLCVKSLVTLTLTVVFAVMAVIIAFYFGTQLERTAQKGSGAA